MGDKPESGVMAVARVVDTSSNEILFGCHELLGQADVVAMNLEFLAEAVDDGEKKAAVDEARLANIRIREIANAIRRFVETATPPVQAAVGSPQTG